MEFDLSMQDDIYIGRLANTNKREFGLGAPKMGMKCSTYENYQTRTDL